MKNKGRKNGGGSNEPPTLPDGERAGKLVVGRENRKARDAASNQNRLAAVPEGPGSIDMRAGDFRAAATRSAQALL